VDLPCGAGRLPARGEEMDNVVGLGLGADDYVTKPFNPRELVAHADIHTSRLCSRTISFAEVGAHSTPR
jgi:DNA-binding response OmpR family regulator